MKIFENTCDIWYCFRKQWKCIQIEMVGKKKIACCYCKKHTIIADEMLKNGEIKPNVPIETYEGL